ncbi:hypothetical protein SASPL_113449 [Salvia splendens]|nr:uncharacterized protein LOC121759657 [Salvia splendens]XP_042030827.1 uncharacterized protein LOC121777592 [Salvia splendens]XP_042032693.1 uncharacterized protein LOC121779427 [Salvia splendens]XP_042034172.1 uncharacterized protein LOC121780625 [Salvia splendens]XP_042040032.1 uncharacterized protein LOC121785693 [Salvia splendens]XP_042040134.1 uncharacterized protein LOC121785769 [Salvia splendens]XP_042041814.1 uncharacterized protein LOC121787204 [Salvia splendens]XP_042042007.1 unc
MSEARTNAPSAGGSQCTQGRSQYRRSSFRPCDRPRRSWSDREELILISALKELVATGWKSDNGFRGGYAQKIEEWLKNEFPTTDLKATPHIQSKITTWKRNYYSLSKILDRSGVGFNVHNDFKIDCSDDQWDQIVRQDPNARTMRHKAWPLWDDWKMIFGNDRATGGTAEGIGEAVANNTTDEAFTSIGESADYYPSFEDFLGSDQVQPGYTNEVVDDNSAQSGQNVAANTNAPPAPAPKKMTRKRKSCDDDSALLNLLSNLHAETNARLDKLTARIGYEIDLGQARKEIFRHLGNIPELTESQRYDLCDIIGKENSRLEIFTGLPDASKPGYVRRIIEKEGLN